MNYLIMRESIAYMFQQNSCYSILIDRNTFWDYTCTFATIVYFCKVIVMHVGFALLDNAPISIKPEDYY